MPPTIELPPSFMNLSDTQKVSLTPSELESLLNQICLELGIPTPKPWPNAPQPPKLPKPDTPNTYAEALKTYREALGIYKAGRASNNEIQQQRNAVMNDIEREITRARNRELLRDSLRNMFDDYLLLADGKRHIALNFLRKQYGAFVDSIPELAGEPTTSLPTRAISFEDNES